MATQNWGVDLSFTAAVDLNSFQYRLVKGGSVAGEVSLATTANGSILGVLQNDPKAGGEAVVRVLGFSKVWASATCSNNCPPRANALLKCSDWGLAIGVGDAAANLSVSSYAIGFSFDSVASGSAYIDAFITPMMQRG